MIKKYLDSRKEEKRRKRLEKREVSIAREYFELIAETLVFVFFVMTFLLQSFVIPTGSMIDNLLIGDHLLVDKVAYSRSLSPVDGFMFPQLELKRGMVVTFRAPHEMDKEYVKRIIGLPGETIKIVNQQVYINGKPLEEKYKKHLGNTKFTIEDGKRAWTEYKTNGNGREVMLKALLDDRERTRLDEEYVKQSDGNYSLSGSYSEPLTRGYNTGQGNDIPINYWYGDNFPLDYLNYDEVDPRFNLKKSYRKYFMDSEAGRVFKVPEDHYFCMGDNRDNSLDSRFWGPVPRDYITGKPWRIYWSYESSTDEYLTPGILHKVKDIFKTLVNFFSKTRWSRTLKRIE